ncbi:MAG: DNA-processing protein DprA [Congregibacter sp.]
MIDKATLADYRTLLTWMGAQTDGLGILLRDCGSPAAVLRASEQRLAELPRSTLRALQQARNAWPGRRPDAFDHQMQDAEFVPFHAPAYPPRLRCIPDPPPWFFARGNLHCLASPAVAIVGSRRASEAGLRAAASISKTLAAAGYTVCSGLALGIDAAAHRGALQAGFTAAVLASGLDRASPYRHRNLAQEISGQGCVLTELPPGTPPSKYQFPRRNRIISGLASATIIIEAALPSGSLHTAAAALEQGREVYTLPWSIFHTQGAGCLRLLRDGAIPITGIDDLCALFPGVAARKTSNSKRQLPSGDTGELIALIGDTPMSLNALQRETGRDIGKLLVLLGELEVAGWLSRVNGLYQRVPVDPC